MGGTTSTGKNIPSDTGKIGSSGDWFSGTTDVYSGVPSDVRDLRSRLTNSLLSGRIQAPNYQPLYQQSNFNPSTGTRTQGSSGQRVGGSSFQGGLSPELQSFLAQIMSGASNNWGSSPQPKPVSSGGAYVQQRPSDVTATQIGAYVGGDGWWYDNQDGHRLTHQEAAQKQGALVSGNSQSNGPGFESGMSNIFEQNIRGPQTPNIADLPGLDVENMRDIGSMGHATIGEDSRTTDIISQIMRSAGMDISAYGGSGGANAIGIPGGSIDKFTPIQSADQIIGQGSPFLQTLLKAYNSQADQNQATGLAAAKESAGNLTGSGYAAALGNVVNRSLGDRNAKFADLLQGTTSQEIQRQLGVAGLENTRNIAQGQLSAQMSMQASQLARQAVYQGRADLMQIAQGLQAKAQQQALLEQQDYSTTYGQRGTAALQDANAANTANRDYFKAGVDRNTNQADNELKNFLEQYRGALGQTKGSANNFLQMLLGMLTTGVGQDQISQRDGFAAAIPGLVKAGASYANPGKSTGVPS